MNKLKYYRERSGLTLSDLSKKTGIAESSINRAERGLMDLNGRTWKILAQVLGCTIDELLNNEQ